MTESTVKKAAAQAGFQIRMQQLIAREVAGWSQAKEAGALAKWAPRLLEGVGEAAGAGGRLFGEGARVTTDAAGSGIRGVAGLLGEGGEGAASGAAGLLGEGGGGAPWYKNLLGAASNFGQAHPGLVGAAGGAAGMKGVDEYQDYRRREHLRNMGGFKRLGLALQMALNPNSAIQSMHL